MSLGGIATRREKVIEQNKLIRNAVLGSASRLRRTLRARVAIAFPKSPST
jgi:hypothetical protein